MAEDPKFKIDLKNFDIDKYLKHCRMFESPEIAGGYDSLSMPKEVEEFRYKYSEHMEKRAGKNKEQMDKKYGASKNVEDRKIKARGKKRWV